MNGALRETFGATGKRGRERCRENDSSRQSFKSRWHLQTSIYFPLTSSWNYNKYLSLVRSLHSPVTIEVIHETQQGLHSTALYEMTSRIRLHKNFPFWHRAQPMKSSCLLEFCLFNTVGWTLRCPHLWAGPVAELKTESQSVCVMKSVFYI